MKKQAHHHLQLAEVKPSDLPFVPEKGNLGQLHAMLEHDASLRADLRVLWYNLGADEPQAHEHYHTLTRNLDLFTRLDTSPDLMVFSEARQFYLGGLFNTYPYKKFVPYSKLAPNKGLYIVSRTPFEYENLGPLAWQPPTSQVIGISPHKNHSRTLIKLTVDVGRQKIELLPVHLCNPWDAMGGTLAKVRAVLWGQDNELVHQIGDLKEKLCGLFGPHMKRDPFLLFGDMNTPSLPWPFSAFSYKLLAQDLEVATEPFPTHTFPVSHTGHSEPKLKIDHALGRLKEHHLQCTQYALPVRGSDHKPLLLTLRERGPGGLISGP